jgi:putative alpha-1,2-mannosidase
VIADGLERGHGYVVDATLNGKPLNRAFLRHDEIAGGGELRFTMQAQPDRDWPDTNAPRPYSMSMQ